MTDTIAQEKYTKIIVSGPELNTMEKSFVENTAFVCPFCGIKATPHNYESLDHGLAYFQYDDPHRDNCEIHNIPLEDRAAYNNPPTPYISELILGDRSKSPYKKPDDNAIKMGELFVPHRKPKNSSGSQAIEYTEISPAEPVLLCCPYCNEPVLEATRNDIDCIGQRYWLQDGDAVIVDPIPHITEKYYEATLLTGECYHCSKTYLVLDSRIILNEVDDDFINMYFWDNKETVGFTNYLASIKNQKWLISRFETDKGIVLQHNFGPYTKHEYPETEKQFLLELGALLLKDPALPGE